MHSAQRPNAAGKLPALPRGLRGRAFTLLEIMLAVLILGMMALVIYRFVQANVRDELTWFCSAGPGVLTRYASGDYRVNLRLRRHDAKSQQLDLGLLRTPKDDTAVSNEHETWVRLIDNVATLQIRFFDSRLNTWVQRWTDTVTLPRLVKVVIGRTDAKVPTEIIVPLARMPL